MPQRSRASTPKQSASRKRVSGGFSARKIQKRTIVFFVTIFAIIGSYVAWKSYAATSLILTSNEFIGSLSVNASMTKETVSSKSSSNVVQIANPSGQTNAAGVLATTSTTLDAGIYNACVSARSTTPSVSGNVSILSYSGASLGSDLGTATYTLATATAYTNTVCISFTAASSTAIAAKITNTTDGGVIRIGNVTFTKTGNAPTTLSPVGVGGSWSLKWSDEFTGTTIDSTKWNVQNYSNYGKDNFEDQCYLSSNATVAGGNLSLTAKRQTVTGCDVNPNGGSTYYWTSGMLTTRKQGGTKKYDFVQGYIEARIKAPRGNPYWPAFWLVSNGEDGQPGWPAYGEFDITEMYGGVPDATFGTLHYASPSRVQTSPDSYNIATKTPNGSLGTRVPPLVTGATNDWHVYGFKWGANRLTWYVDGKPFQYFDGASNSLYTVNSSGTATKQQSFAAPSTNFWIVPHSIDLNLAVGGDGPAYYGYTGYDTSSGYVNGNLAADTPGSMQVDYVRVWQ